MPKARTAKVIHDGRTQAVHLPPGFRFKGDQVRIQRVGNGVLLTPIVKVDVAAWFAKLDKFRDIPFTPQGREQPEMPTAKLFD